MWRLLVAVALAGAVRANAQECPGDTNADGAVSLGELQICVDSFLGAGCLTATPTPTSTPTNTPGTGDCCDAGFLCGPPSSGNCPIGVPVFHASCDGGSGHCATFTPTPTPRFALVPHEDGTVTDSRTGLIWEKKINPGGGDSIHWQNVQYNWGEANSVFIANLNSGAGFAGYKDWRLPNLYELQAIVDYDTGLQPTVASVFSGPCCTDIATCSCTQPDGYWSQTSSALDGSRAWYVFFGSGQLLFTDKGNALHVRAVRGP